MSVNKKPVLTAKDMAEYLYKKCFTDKYKRDCLTYLETIHAKSYVDEVRKLMNEMRKK